MNTGTWIGLLAWLGFAGPSASQQVLDLIEDRDADNRLMCSLQSRTAIKDLTDVDSVVQQFQDSPCRPFAYLASLVRPALQVGQSSQVARATSTSGQREEIMYPASLLFVYN